MRELKQINFNDKKFEANGKTYLIEQTFSQDRWRMWRKIQVELPFDLTYDSLFEKLKEAWSYLNKPQPQPLDAGVILYNIMQGLKNVMDDKQVPLVIRLCALFMNTPDEDRRTITESMIQEKADDWNKEGIDMNSFFLFAISSIPNLMPSYEKIIQDISDTTKKAQEMESLN